MTAQRPTEESNPHLTVCYFFGPYQEVISICKEVKDRPARTPNVVFVDIKTNYKPTETFQYTDTLPRSTLPG